MSSKVDKPVWLDLAASDAWKKARKILAEEERQETLSKYAADPVGFGTEVLGEQYTDEVKQVMESVRDFPITIAKSANGTGKSHGAARIALWFYLVFPDAKVYMTAAPPLENLKRILWGEVMTIVQRFPLLFRNDKKLSMNISRTSNSFVTGVAIPTSGSSEDRVAKFSGKHAPHILFIVDEGDAVPDEVYTGIEGCMSGGYARMLIMFNPKATFGPVYQKEYTKAANVVHLSAFNHPNVVSGKDIIPGAVDRNITMRRINEWTIPLPPEDEKRKIALEESFDVPDYLVGAVGIADNGVPYPPLPAGKRKIIEPSFSYMVMGEYPPQSEMQLISRAWINVAVERWKMYRKLYGNNPPANVKPLMGVDPAELGGDPNVVCLRYGDYVAPFITWNGVDSDMSAIQSMDLYLEHNVEMAYIDATGVGSHIAPRMSREGRDMDVRAVAVKVGEKPTIGSETSIGRFYSLRDELWWNVREWLRTSQTAMIPDDPMLIMDLSTPTYDTVQHKGRIKISDKKTMRERLRRSPDRADALCLTFMPLMRPTIMRLTDYARTEA